MEGVNLADSLRLLENCDGRAALGRLQNSMEIPSTAKLKRLVIRVGSKVSERGAMGNKRYRQVVDRLIENVAEHLSW